MLNVLWILKIIGIVLLFIIGFLFVLLLLALLIPVRYKICVKKKDDTYAYFRLNWLLRVVRLKAEYKQKNVVFKFSILGLPLDKIVNAVKNRQNKKTKDKKTVSKKNDKDKLCSVEKKEDEVKKDVVDKKTTKYKKEQKNKKSWSENKKIFIEKIDNLKESISKGFSKIDEVKEFIGKKSNKTGINTIKEYAYKLLKHVRPRKIKATVRFGCNEPDKTGEILAVTSIVYAWYGSNIDYNVQKNIKIIPDFEREIFEVNSFVKGRICGIKILIILIKAYGDKKIKHLMKNYSKAFK